VFLQQRGIPSSRRIVQQWANQLKHNAREARRACPTIAACNNLQQPCQMYGKRAAPPGEKCLSGRVPTGDDQCQE
jgi:hypothetical protein